MVLRSGVGREGSVAIKGQRRDPSGDGNVLHLDCFGICILNVMLYCLVRYFLWGKLGKKYMRLFILFLQQLVNYNYLKIRFLIKVEKSGEFKIR